jgi:hypothetical protein
VLKTDPAAEKKLAYKIDRYIILPITLCYICCFIESVGPPAQIFSLDNRQPLQHRKCPSCRTRG